MDYTKSVDFLIGSAYRELEAQQEEIMTEIISCISIKDVVIRIYRGFRLGIFMECTNMDTIDYAGIREIIRKYTGGYMSLEFSVPKGFLRDEQKKSRKNKNTACLFIILNYYKFCDLKHPEYLAGSD